MPTGFQVMNSAGIVMCDGTDRITRVEAFIVVTPGVPGSYTLKTSGTPFFAVLDEGPSWNQNVTPSIRINGQTISWSGGNGIPVNMMVGVY